MHAEKHIITSSHHHIITSSCPLGPPCHTFRYIQRQRERARARAREREREREGGSKRECFCVNAVCMNVMSVRASVCVYTCPYVRVSVQTYEHFECKQVTPYTYMHSIYMYALHIHICTLYAYMHPIYIYALYIHICRNGPRDASRHHMRVCYSACDASRHHMRVCYSACDASRHQLRS